MCGWPLIMNTTHGQHSSCLALKLGLFRVHERNPSFFQMDMTWNNCCKQIAYIFLFPILLFKKMYYILEKLENPDEEEESYKLQRALAKYERKKIEKSNQDLQEQLANGDEKGIHLLLSLTL